MIKFLSVLRSLGIGGSFLCLLLTFSILAPSTRATELTDLGEGLSYLRVHAIDESAKGLTSSIREREFLVLDLRHANTTTASAALLRTALEGRTSKQPVFILIGPATPSSIGEILASATGKCVTLGVKEAMPMPHVIIEQPADADRLAYEALESGQTIDSLISGKIGKDRFDEAALMKEFNGGNIAAAPPAPRDPTAKPAAPEKTAAPVKPALPAANGTQPDKTEPITDRVLQRAVHLHRALLAIKPRSG